MEEIIRGMLRRHPCYNEEDVLKTLFQVIYGNGHRRNTQTAVQLRIAEEMARTGEDAGEPLVEELGAWLRLNLRPAKRLGLRPSWIAAMMRLSRPQTPDPQRARLARAVSELGELPGVDRERLWLLTQTLLAANDLPSHSARCYREEDPAYRILDAAWQPVIPVLTALAAVWREEPMLMTIDGPSAAGKSIFAEILRLVLDAPVIHTDDYCVPHSRKTPERLAIPGGNLDIERLETEIITPHFNQANIILRRYDCHENRLTEIVHGIPKHGMILEGCYSNLPSIRERAQLRLFLEVSRDVAEKRIARRNTAAEADAFRERWIPLEQAYFKAFNLPDEGCLVIKADSMELDRLQACLTAGEA